MTQAPPVKKACDACHRRKVRCTGGQPCKNCGQASLQCTYLAVPQKKGPKGSRAKVITEIRDTQQHKPPLPSASEKSPTPIKSSSHESESDAFDFNTSPMSPISHGRNLELLSPQTVDDCIDFFFSQLYPTMPIFSRRHLDSLALEYRNGTPETYCLVLSLCAFILVQAGMSYKGVPTTASHEEDPAAARYRLANRLHTEIQRIRKSIDYIDNPTVLSVQISFFLFCSYFGLDKSNIGYYYLREASTLAHLLNMSEEASYKSGDYEDNERRRRFYWLILITERAVCLQRHKPLSMLASIELPLVDADSPEAPVLNGYMYLASLFRLMDDEFMALWNKAKSECTTSYLSNLQAQLVDVIPPILQCTENQAADVKITQNWLRCIVWQLSITNGYLSSSSEDPAMSFKYPIEITRDLLRDIEHINLQAMEVHGVGLIEKLFDMSCTLSDVLTYVPIEQQRNGNTESPHDYLNQLLNLISRLRGGASRYVPLLMAKVAENLNLPNASNPLSHMPETLDAFMDSPSSTDSNPAQAVTQQQHRRMRQTAPQYVQLPSPSRSFGTQVFAEQNRPPDGGLPRPQDRLMFETYSPSIASHSEPAQTPQGYTMSITPGSQYGHHPVPNNQPRSVPLQPALMKQGSWHGFPD